MKNPKFEDWLLLALAVYFLFMGYAVYH
jgi:hypothetical protein